MGSSGSQGPLEYRLLGIEDAEEWLVALDRQPQKDVYFLPQYHAAYEKAGKETAKVFVFEDDTGMFFYPFMLRQIETTLDGSTDTWFDIETVYGYTGPLSTTGDPLFLSRAWKVFEQACRDLRVIAEFTRFSPIVGNAALAPIGQSVVLDRDTVVVDLLLKDEDTWSGYSTSHRRKIRRAISLGLECQAAPLSVSMEVFKGLYLRTMTHVGAQSFYFFSERYFQFLADNLEPHLIVFLVYHKHIAVAASLFLLYGETIHYHLGGRLIDYDAVAPNPLLFHRVITWARQQGYRWLHLGGGRTPHPDDDLLRFKGSISPLRRQFHTGRRVHNQAVYDRLCSEWMQRNGLTSRPNYFLLYRLDDFR